VPEFTISLGLGPSARSLAKHVAAELDPHLRPLAQAWRRGYQHHRRGGRGRLPRGRCRGPRRGFAQSPDWGVAKVGFVAWTRTRRSGCTWLIFWRKMINCCVLCARSPDVGLNGATSRYCRRNSSSWSCWSLLARRSRRRGGRGGRWGRGRGGRWGRDDLARGARAAARGARAAAR